MLASNCMDILTNGGMNSMMEISPCLTSRVSYLSLMLSIVKSDTQSALMNPLLRDLDSMEQEQTQHVTVSTLYQCLHEDANRALLLTEATAQSKIETLCKFLHHALVDRLHVVLEGTDRLQSVVLHAHGETFNRTDELLLWDSHMLLDCMIQLLCWSSHSHEKFHEVCLVMTRLECSSSHTNSVLLTPVLNAIDIAFSAVSGSSLNTFQNCVTPKRSVKILQSMREKCILLRLRFDSLTNGVDYINEGGVCSLFPSPPSHSIASLSSTREIKVLVSHSRSSHDQSQLERFIATLSQENVKSTVINNADLSIVREMVKNSTSIVVLLSREYCESVLNRVELELIVEHKKYDASNMMPLYFIAIEEDDGFMQRVKDSWIQSLIGEC